MEHLIFAAAMISLMLILFIKGVWDSNRQKAYQKKRLSEEYGKIPDRTYKADRYLRIDSYFRKHPQEGQLDDITWNDLNLDDLFKRMNTTFSSAGEEYLYYTLRTPRKEKLHLTRQEQLTEFFAGNEKARMRVQLLMMELGTTGNYSLYDYLNHLDTLGKRSTVRILAMDMLLLLSFVSCFWNASLGVAAAAVLAVYQIVTYFKQKKEIEPYVISFTYVMRLLRVCEKLQKEEIPLSEENDRELQDAAEQLKKLKTGSGWVLTGSRAVGSGNPLEILMDYGNMIFHLDILLFDRMLGQLRQHLKEVDILVSQVGAIETAICIGAFRASLEHGWCKPQFLQADERNGIVLEEGYHPLLSEPVKNSIEAGKGVLLTGSNASGKSTFLKTVAINAILAQTINTCTADGYRAPFYRIYSSMALRDHLESGESYYIVEIKALKRILEEAEKISGLPVLCFVDEVLRGTNTVERIAASTQILKSLGKKQILCFAATHDIELTDLLDNYYLNYHFEEEVRDGDIFFPYRLFPGKATTRNAIRLLELIGYDETIITQANRMAEEFVENGYWKL